MVFQFVSKSTYDTEFQLILFSSVIDILPRIIFSNITIQMGNKLGLVSQICLYM